jgi:hypothetical protein
MIGFHRSTWGALRTMALADAVGALPRFVQQLEKN